MKDRDDYRLVLEEFGLTEAQVRSATEVAADQIPFPESVTAAAVGPSKIEGLGLMATVALEAGELIAPARIDGKRTPAGRFTNHAKKPNAQMLVLGEDLWVAALEEIPQGAEITVDYRHTARLNIASVSGQDASDVTAEMVRDGLLGQR